MENPDHNRALVAQTYAALRLGGAPQARAQAELAVTPAQAREMEALFRVRRPGSGCDAMRPRFARHDAHVRAVLRRGGYPVLPR